MGVQIILRQQWKLKVWFVFAQLLISNRIHTAKERCREKRMIESLLWRKDGENPQENAGVFAAFDCPCLQARTCIFTPAKRSVTRTPNVHSHACMQAFIYVDIYTHITARACGETQYGKHACRLKPERQQT